MCGVHVWYMLRVLCTYAYMWECVHVCYVSVHDCVHTDCVLVWCLCASMFSCTGACLCVHVGVRTCGDQFCLHQTEKHITSFLGRKACKHFYQLCPGCCRAQPPSETAPASAQREQGRCSPKPYHTAFPPKNAQMMAELVD